MKGKKIYIAGIGALLILVVGIIAFNSKNSGGNFLGSLTNIVNITPSKDITIKSPNLRDLKISPYIINLTVSQNPYEPSKGPLTLTYDTNYVQKTSSDKIAHQYITKNNPNGTLKNVSISTKSFDQFYSSNGTNTLTWDGRDQNTGNLAAPGKYFFTVGLHDDLVPAVTIPFEIK